jgi:acetyl-CoA carboxylase carboxyltransferase component
MRMLAHRRTVAAVVGLAATAAIATGCASTDKAKEAASGATAAAGSVLSSAVVAPASSAVATASSAVESATASAEDIKLKGAQGRDVTLTGPIAVKYAAATDAQKKDLGPARTLSRSRTK